MAARKARPSIHVRENHGVVAETIRGPVAVGANAMAVNPPAPSPGDSRAASRLIRLFLASSSELREDRDGFDLHFRQLNDTLRSRNVYLEVDRWETGPQAMAPGRTQDEYNARVCACDLFVALFATKAGEYTQEEFEAASRSFLAHGRPLVFTYFKNVAAGAPGATEAELRSLVEFQAKLQRIGHFWSKYSTIESLQNQFRRQLDKVIDAR